MKNKKYKVPFFARPSYKDIKSHEREFDDETYYFAGTEKELKILRIVSIISCVLAAGVVIGEASLRIEAMQSILYIIIPYMVEFIGTFIFIVLSINLIEYAREMSKKKYARTVKTLPVAIGVVAVGACAGIIGSVIYLIINGFEGCLVARIFYLVFKAVLIANMLYMMFFLRKHEWKS